MSNYFCFLGAEGGNIFRTNLNPAPKSSIILPYPLNPMLLFPRLRCRQNDQPLAQHFYKPTVLQVAREHFTNL